MPKKKRAGRRRKKKLNWFSRLFGFNEKAQTYKETQDLLLVKGTTITSKKNSKSYQIGEFVRETLGEQRARVMKNEKVEHILRKQNGLVLDVKIADVSKLHIMRSNRHATFQVASQFNCLEFVGPDVTPEDGITGYFRDRTQGPACSIACGPATAFRNYFASVKKRNGSIQIGQTEDLMINNLSDFSVRVGNSRRGNMFQMKGGYTIANREGLAQLRTAIEAHGNHDSLRDLIRVGVHSDVQVTSHSWGTKLLRPLSAQPAAGSVDSKADLTDPADTSVEATAPASVGASAGDSKAATTSGDGDEGGAEAEVEVQTVTQVFCSAIACGYNKGVHANDWLPMAQIVLDAAYEATFLAAIDAAVRHPTERGARKVYVTLLGGGVFGNPYTWILQSIKRACERYRHYDLEVYIVSYSQSVDTRIADLVRTWQKKRKCKVRKAVKKDIAADTDKST